MFLRITPAYAGKSRFVRHSGILTQDHPRLCGEKGVVRRGHGTERGSPPPMRGKEKAYTYMWTLQGITPAYAGKSPNPSLILVVIGDHPRLCGEKTKSNCPLMQTLGSPPPMRGKGARFV